MSSDWFRDWFKAELTKDTPVKRITSSYESKLNRLLEDYQSEIMKEWEQYIQSLPMRSRINKPKGN